MSDFHKIMDDISDLQNELRILRQKSFKTDCYAAAAKTEVITYTYVISGLSEIGVEITASGDGVYSVTVDGSARSAEYRFDAFKLSKGKHTAVLTVNAGASALIKFYGNGLRSAVI